MSAPFFQEAAISRIVQRLTTPGEPWRYLLADEVGLGKTIVTSGVVEKLYEQHLAASANDKPFVVVYVSSNSEIAAQNRTKVIPNKHLNAVDPSVGGGRLSLLCLQPGFFEPAGSLRVFSFTPGTSFNMGRSTGQAAERRLLLRVLERDPRFSEMREKLRLMLRCGCGLKNWWEGGHETWEQTRFEDIEKDRGTEVARGWRQRFRAFATQVITRWDGDGELLARVRSLSEGWPIPESTPEEGREARREWDRQHTRREGAWESQWGSDVGAGETKRGLIGRLRAGLALAALDYIEPSLVVMDEFQRFREVLEHSYKPGTIESQLLGDNARVLLLSATPYKLFSLSCEDPEKNYRDFIKVLAFLYKVDMERDKASAAHGELQELQAIHALFRESDELRLGRTLFRFEVVLDVIGNLVGLFFQPGFHHRQ